MKIFKVLLVVVLFLFLAAPDPPPEMGAYDTSRMTMRSVANGAYTVESGVTSRGGLFVLAAKILRTVLATVGVLLTAAVIYSGFLWMSAGGNEEQVTKAKAWLRNSILGFLLVFFAYMLTGVILGMAAQVTTESTGTRRLFDLLFG